MSGRIVYVASNTFREAVRDRVLYNLVAFALLLSGTAILVGQISVGIERLGSDQSGAYCGFVIRNRNRDIHWNRTGVKGDRQENALHNSFASGQAMGIHCREIFRVGRDAGGEHILHGHRGICRSTLCIATFSTLRWLDSSCFVFHSSPVFGHYIAGTFIFLLFVAFDGCGICVFSFCDW